MSTGFEYVAYNDVDDLKKTVKRINRRGRIGSLFGRPRRGVAAILMEPLQVSQDKAVTTQIASILRFCSNGWVHEFAGQV